VIAGCFAAVTDIQATTTPKEDAYMNKNNTPGKKRLVKIESAVLTAFVALVIGFLGGIVFSAFKMDSGAVSPGVMTAAGDNHDHEEVTEEIADKIALLENAASSDPGNLEGWVALGNACFDFNQYQKAIMAYQKALEIEPGNADIWTDLGVMYRRNEEPGNAIAAFERPRRFLQGMRSPCSTRELC
jgi:cytochrome c-type biogenesis protein CcmH/NrfG